jgi:hypothetical protein
MNLPLMSVYRERMAKTRAKSLKRAQDQSEFNIKDHTASADQPSIEDKRENKYLAKFGFRIKQVSNICQSGKRMGTPAPIGPKGIREISKYLKRDEVS